MAIMNIGQLACHLILKTSKSNKDILAIIHEKFPESKTTEKSLSWYRHDLKKKGMLVDKPKGVEIDLGEFAE